MNPPKTDAVGYRIGAMVAAPVQNHFTMVYIPPFLDILKIAPIQYFIYYLIRGDLNGKNC